MNQDTVKTLLQSLHECSAKFSVTFTGKKSTKVNGLYKPDTHEILLHNKNFNTDNQLLYTAIHEYAHHLVCCNTGNATNGKSHTTYFWATFHELLQKAEETGLYTVCAGLTGSAKSEFEQLLQTVKKFDDTIAQSERELSMILCRIHSFCEGNNVRFEDVLDRRVNLSRSRAKKCNNIAKGSYNCGDFSTDQKTFLLTLSNIDKKQEAMEMFENGKTIEQVKLAVKKQDTAVEQKDAGEKIAELKKQKNKIESSIHKMHLQVRAIANEIDTLRG